MPRVAQGGQLAGDTALRGNVVRSNGFAADAPDLTLTILDADGDPIAGFPVAIPPIVRDALGEYHYDWTVPADLPTSEAAGGDYTATWTGTVDGDETQGSEAIEVVLPGEIETSEPGEVVAFDVFRDHLGVAADSAEVDDVRILFDALNAECRRITGLGFEGAGGATYDEIIRTFGAREFTLPRGPVASITSLTRQAYDGTDDGAPFDTRRYRLEEAARGRVSVLASAEYIHAVWVVTGEVPPQVVEAMLEWGKDRWDTRDQAAGLSSYQTGQDAESYSVTLAGKPPRGAIALLLAVSVVPHGAVV